MSYSSDFLKQVDAFLKRTGVGSAILGREALNDPSFVANLRNGRSPSAKTMDRVAAWMRAHEGRSTKRKSA